MILRPEQIELLRLGYPVVPCNIGGDQKQDSKTDNSNTMIDKRLVTDGESVGVSADRSNVTVNKSTSDFGAIAKAFDFATTSRKSVSDDFGRVVDLAGDALDFSQESQRMTSKAQSTATDQVSAAFKAMQSAVTGRDQLVVVGMVVAGAVGLAALGGKIKL